MVGFSAGFSAGFSTGFSAVVAWSAPSLFIAAACGGDGCAGASGVAILASEGLASAVSAGRGRGSGVRGGVIATDGPIGAADLAPDAGSGGGEPGELLY